MRPCVPVAFQPAAKRCKKSEKRAQRRPEDSQTIRPVSLPSQSNSHQKQERQQLEAQLPSVRRTSSDKKEQLEVERESESRTVLEEGGRPKALRTWLQGVWSSCPTTVSGWELT